MYSDMKTVSASEADGVAFQLGALGLHDLVLLSIIDVLQYTEFAMVVFCQCHTHTVSQCLI